jgi:uncharacterized protein involved in outer membrane biogenesis
MAIGRRTKLWLILLGIPLFLLIAGVIAVKAYFTSERLRDLLVPRIEEATGRAVTIADLSLSVFPSLAIEIDSLTMSNPPQGGFSERAFLSLPRLVLDLRLMPLLDGRVEIPTVLLENPVANLEITSDGKRNYRFGEPAKTPATPAEPSSMTATPLILSNLQVTGGTVEYVDHQENSMMVAEGVHLATSIETDTASRQARVRIESSVDQFSYGSLASMMIKDLPLTMKGDLFYREKEELMVIENGTGSAAKIMLTVKGTVASPITAPTLDITVESPSAEIPDLLSLAPKEYMKKAEGLEGKGTARVQIRMTGLVSDSTKPDVTGIVSATNASMRYASLPKPITNINLVADFTRTPRKQEFRLTKFSANLGENPISASMTVVNFDNPSMTLAVDASMNLAEVGDYYPLDAGTSMSGMTKASLRISGLVSDPYSMKASGSLNFKDVVISGEKQIRDLNGSISFNNQLLEAKQLSMKIGQSDLSLAFQVRNYLTMLTEAEKGAKPSASMTLTSKHLLTSDLSGEPKGNTTGAQQEQKEKSQAGLPLPGVDMDINASIGKLTMEKFELTNVKASMRVSNGVMTLHNFSGNTFDGSVVTKGNLNLQNPERPTFDLTLDLTGLDAHQMLPNFTSFGNRLFGDLTISTRLKGEMDDTLGLVSESLDGGGKVELKSGKLEGVKVNDAVAGLVGLPDLSVIDFKDWQNSFSIAKGRMQVKDLKISALKSDYLVNGSVGFDGSLDYLMTLYLPPDTKVKLSVPGIPSAYVGQAVDLFKDSSGRIRLDFNVTGFTDSPRVSMNTEAAQRKAEDLVKQKLAAEQKKLEEELKKKAGDLLKDFDPFKKKKKGP